MTPGQKRSIGLHVGTFVSGVVAAVSVMASSGIDLYSAYEHAYAGVRELMAAWAIVGPVLCAGYAAYYASTRKKLQEAVADPKAVEIAREMPATPQAVEVGNALKSNGAH